MDKKGFTLLELMIVIVILGILAALISGNFITSLKKGRDARRKSDLSEIQKSLEMYYEDVRAYPTPIPGDVGFVFGSKFSYVDAGGNQVKTYMQVVPNDPTPNHNYLYVSNGQSYQLYACLESDQQILPYTSDPTKYGAFSCSTQCFKSDGTTTSCIWGISDAGSTP